jgi:integrase
MDSPKRRRQSNRIPKHRRHATGQGVVTLSGKDYYTGVFGTAKSEQRYREIIGEWIASDRKILPVKKSTETEELGISVAELCLRFINHARAVYVDDNGNKREELRALEWATDYLNEHYGLIPASAFGRKHLLEIRDTLVRKRFARLTINGRIARIKTVFQWGSDRELIADEVAGRLSAVKSLKPGEEGVREMPKVEPVADDIVEKTIPHLRPQLQAFVRLLRLTGARSGELCILRPCDVTPSEHDPETLVYRPAKHKTQMIQSREVFIFPAARVILEPLMKGLKPEEYVFMGPQKKGPLTPQDIPRPLKKAAEKAKVKPWKIHQLRHAFGTEMRRLHGADVAQTLLGHRSIVMTERYAGPDVAKAIRAAKTETPSAIADKPATVGNDADE